MTLVVAVAAVAVVACCALAVTASDDSDATIFNGKFDSGNCHVEVRGTHCYVTAKPGTDGRMSNYSGYVPPCWLWLDIDSITIEEGVTYIGDFAFAHDTAGLGRLNYTSVYIPSSVEGIGKFAFESSDGFQTTNRLNSLTFAPYSHLKTIGISAFENCELKSVKFPSSLVSIEKNAFRHNEDLSVLELPASLVTVGDNAFDECHVNLLKFPYNSCLKSIGTGAFRWIVKDGLFNVPSSVESIGKNAFGYGNFYNAEGKKITSVADIRGHWYVEDAHDGASPAVKVFDSGNCTVTWNDGTLIVSAKSGTDGRMCDYSSGAEPWHGLDIKAYQIEEGVTYIGANAFTGSSGCLRPTTVTIPASVTEIGAYAFARPADQCIESITFATGSNLRIIGEGAFEYETKLSSLELPASVTEIRSRAFCGCTDLSSVNFSSCASLVLIGAEAFEYDVKLVSLEFPASLVEIGDRAFYECKSVVSVSFPLLSSLKTIGDEAFFGCFFFIGHVEIPASVEKIGKAAFGRGNFIAPISGDWGHSLTDKYRVLTADAENLAGHTFNKGGDRWMLVAETRYDYESGNCLVIFKDGTLTITAKPGTDGRMADYSTRNPAPWPMSKIRDIVVDSGVTYIGAYAFGGSGFVRCEAFTLTFASDSHLTAIGNFAFFNCCQLRSVYIPVTVTSIGMGAFMHCVRLASVTVGPGTIIGTGAFDGCPCEPSRSTSYSVVDEPSAVLPEVSDTTSDSAVTDDTASASSASSDGTAFVVVASVLIALLSTLVVTGLCGRR